MKKETVGQSKNHQGDVLNLEKLLEGTDVTLLTKSEHNLFNYLINNCNRILTRKELMENVWGCVVVPRAVDVQISKIRHKFPQHASLIKTAIPEGYIFVNPYQKDGQGIVLHKKVKLYPEQRKLIVDDEQRSLRPMGFDILKYMANNPGRIIDRKEITRHFWEGTIIGETTINVHMHNIRKALSPYEHIIESVKGTGYMFRKEQR